MGQGDLQGLGYLRWLGIRGELRGADSKGRYPARRESVACPVVWHPTLGIQRREAKSKGEKERYTYLNAEFQRIARRDKEAFLSDQ